MVLRVGGGDDITAKDALASLCARYWPPLYAFVRSKGFSREDAEDIVQGFFAKLLRNENLHSADPDRGRLRSFLLSAMRRYLISDYQKRATLKRGGGVDPIAIDGAEGERIYLADPAPSPEQSFERNWAVTVLTAVHERLREESTKKDAAEIFAALEAFVTPAGGEIPYAELATQLGVAVGTIKVRVFRLRNRYRDCLREEVARGLDDPDDEQIDEELRHLRDALRLR